MRSVIGAVLSLALLSGCSGQGVDPRDALDVVRGATPLAFKAAVEICDAREEQIIEGEGSIDDKAYRIARIRERCDKVFDSLGDVAAASSVVDQLIERLDE